MKVELLRVVVLVHPCSDRTNVVVDVDDGVLLRVEVVNDDLRLPISLAIDGNKVLERIKLCDYQVVTGDLLIDEVFPRAFAWVFFIQLCVFHLGHLECWVSRADIGDDDEEVSHVVDVRSDLLLAANEQFGYALALLTFFVAF